MSILFADLAPKRIGMIAPEAVVLRVTNPIYFYLYVYTPLAWFFNGLMNITFRIFKLPMVRKDDITSDDIYVVMGAGVLADMLRKQGHKLIKSVFGLESHTIPSSMTLRESMIWFGLHEDEQSLKNKIVGHPHLKFLVYNEDTDRIIGYVDSKDLLGHMLTNQGLTLNGSIQIRNTLVAPNALTLSEALENSRTAGEDFAVIASEYALVVRIITLDDVMTTLMGDLVGQGLEEQIVVRDKSSQLINGSAPIDDVMRMLDTDEFPQSGSYETIGDFMMLILRKVPRRIDSVKFADCKFKVVGINNYRIDQPLVVRIDSKAAAPSLKLPDTKDKEEGIA